MKTNTTTTAPVMDAATIASTAAAILKACKNIAGIKARAASYREKYGPKNWAAILSKAKEFRAADINAAAKGAIEAVFNYRAILGAAYRTLSADSNYKQLCKYAAASYKGTDADTAAALVRDYYTNIDAESGAPLARVDWCDTAKGLIYVSYSAPELTAARALSVLKGAINGMKSAAHAARRKGTDATTATVDNKRTAGAIVAVFEAGIGPADTIARGACLAGNAPTTDASKAASVASAAALVGRPVPSDCVRVSELNAAARAAHAAAADKALQEKRAGIVADAAAAGVATTAPARKGRKASKASTAAVA